MKFEKKHFTYVVISLLVALVVILIYNGTNILDNIELDRLDKAFDMRNDRPPPPSEDGSYQQLKINPRMNQNVIIVGIDSESLQEIGRWPWPRSVYGEFLDHIRSADPAVVFFDIFLVEHSRDKSQDEALIAALKRFPHKVLFDYPFQSTADGFNIDKMEDRYGLFVQKSLDGNETTENMWEYNDVDIPIPEVLRNVYDIAEAVILPDTDNKMRKAPLFLKFKGRLYPFIALNLARAYYNVPKENVEVVLGKYVRLKDARVPVYGKFGEMVDYSDIVDYEIKDITIPINRLGQMSINYSGHPREFERNGQYISFQDALNTDPEIFRGKILMIGMFAQGVAHDVWPSPHGIMYGIEHNAFALNTILMEDYLDYAPAWLNILLIVLIALMIGLIVPRMNIAGGAGLALGLGVIGVLVTQLAFSWGNIIMFFLAPPLITILSFSGVIIYRILTEEKEKAFIRKRFSKYVSSSVVDELLKNPKELELGGVNKIITVMFSDVRGFTTISEKLGDPQKLVNLLNDYLGSMTELIIKYDGTLDKYVGDEIMAFWGAPLEQPDHALRTCKSALEQMYFLTHILNPRLKEEGKPELDIGIGINTGEMTVGNMGSENRMDYTLMGDNVNLGARLEGTNKVYGTNIIISEFTYEVVKDDVIVRELDNIRVKGKSKPVRIYELIAVKGHDAGEGLEQK